MMQVWAGSWSSLGLSQPAAVAVAAGWVISSRNRQQQHNHIVWTRVPWFESHPIISLNNCYQQF